MKIVMSAMESNKAGGGDNEQDQNNVVEGDVYEDSTFEEKLYEVRESSRPRRKR